MWELLAAGTPGYVQGLSQVQPSEVRLGSQASHVLGNGPSLQQWVESGLTMAITARDMYDGRTKGTWAAASVCGCCQCSPKQAPEPAPPVISVTPACGGMDIPCLSLEIPSKSIASETEN